MGEIRTLHTVLDAIYDPTTINNALRAGAKEIQDWLGWMFFDEFDTGHGVHGFKATVASLNVTVARGAGLVRNASAPSPASKWAWIYMGASQVVACSARHATEDRIDLVSVSWAQDPDTVVNVGYEGDVPADTPTQRGCQSTIVITKGVEDGSLAVPSTPAGHEALWQVKVPSTADGGALTLYDVRRYLPGPKYRTREEPIVYRGFAGDLNAAIATFQARATPSAPAVSSAIFWNWAADWLLFTRGSGGSKVPFVYPLGTPEVDGSDRPAWERAFTMAGYQAVYKAGSAAQITATWVYPDHEAGDTLGIPLPPYIDDASVQPYLEVERIANGADARLYLWLPVTVDIRGVKLTEFSVQARKVTAFTNNASWEAACVIFKADGTIRGSLHITPATTGTGASGQSSADSDFTEYSALGSSGELVPEENDRIWAFVRFDLASGETAQGKVRFLGFKLRFGEGQQN